MLKTIELRHIRSFNFVANTVFNIMQNEYQSIGAETYTQF